jgi:RNase P/RNase MRP subunit p29
MKTLTLISRAAIVLVTVTGLTACGGGSNVSNISVSGTITGLSTGTLTLNNGSSSLTLPTNTSTFTFTARVPTGYSFNTVVTAQSADLTCRVTNGSGVASGDVTNVVVACVPNQTLGGVVYGLTAAGLVLANGSDTVGVPVNTGTFVLPTKIGDGFAYGVTVLTQPAGLTCTVQNGVGKMGTTNVSNVAVNCVPTPAA